MAVPVTQSQSVLRGETRGWLVTVTDENDARIDLNGVDEIEFQVKKRMGRGDPPLVFKSIAMGGITVLDQSAPATKGQFELLLTVNDTKNLPAARYRYDVVIVAGSQRQYVVPPSDFELGDVVNCA